MSCLSELEKLGITIVALARAGAIEYDCSFCTTVKGLQEDRNCGCKDIDRVVFYHPMIGELTACPIRYVAPAIFDFFDRLDYLGRYPSTAPPYDECNPRFWEAEKYYLKISGKIAKDLSKESNSKTDGFSSIVKRHKNRK